MQQLGVSPDVSVVNCVSHKIPSTAPVKKYLNLKMRDKGTYDILYDLLNFIEFVENENDKVIVHCRNGMSRSGVLVMGYLMYKL